MHDNRHAERFRRKAYGRTYPPYPTTTSGEISFIQRFALRADPSIFNVEVTSVQGAWRSKPAASKGTNVMPAWATRRASTPVGVPAKTTSSTPVAQDVGQCKRRIDVAGGPSAGKNDLHRLLLSETPSLPFVPLRGVRSRPLSSRARTASRDRRSKRDEGDTRAEFAERPPREGRVGTAARTRCARERRPPPREFLIVLVRAPHPWPLVIDPDDVQVVASALMRGQRIEPTETDMIRPTINSDARIEDPPEEMNGSGLPVVGEAPWRKPCSKTPEPQA